LIEREPALGEYRLSLKYFKLAENEYSREALLRQRSIISLLFLAEAHYDLSLLYGPLVSLFEEEPDRQAVQVFLNWFEQLVVRGYRPAVDLAVIEREYANVEEVQSMLIKAIERDREQLLKTGEARGEARGRAERTQQIVQAMHTRGFDPTLIADIVGLTSAEVAAMLAQPASTPQPPRPRKRRKS
jgi:hypothetical protein